LLALRIGDFLDDQQRVKRRFWIRVFLSIEKLPI